LSRTNQPVRGGIADPHEEILMLKIHKTLILAVGLSAIALGGCSNYVKKTDFDAAIQRLQAKDQDLQSQINSLSQNMKQEMAKTDARITAMEGRINVDNIAYFDFNKADLHDSDKAKLQAFANVMNKYHGNAMVTVEGFADAAGSRAYNKKLGMERADAVRNFLITDGGMTADQVRAVSYGKAMNRQVQPGKSHEAGADNRRATLVVDFAGTRSDS
jgi:peptidoglycan-associated lipoprotein